MENLRPIQNWKKVQTSFSVQFPVLYPTHSAIQYFSSLILFSSTFFSLCKLKFLSACISILKKEKKLALADDLKEENIFCTTFLFFYFIFLFDSGFNFLKMNMWLGIKKSGYYVDERSTIFRYIFDSFEAYTERKMLIHPSRTEIQKYFNGKKLIAQWNA